MEKKDRMIQLFKPSYDEREIEAVAEVLGTGWTGLGPKTSLFENAFAEFCSTKYCVGLSNGTAALQMALKLLDIGPGDEVIVPAITFVATAHSVLNSGAVPVFSDICPITHNIDPAHAGQLVNGRTKAIIAVHLAGYPVDMDALRSVAKDLPLIEDCAHASGTIYKGKPAGSMGIAGCFSFHAVKNLSMGEGGALVTDRDDFNRRARRLRWLGIDRETWDRQTWIIPTGGSIRWTRQAPIAIWTTFMPPLVLCSCRNWKQPITDAGRSRKVTAPGWRTFRRFLCPDGNRGSQIIDAHVPDPGGKQG